MSKSGTVAEKNKIQEQRFQLLGRINNFHTKAEAIYENVDQEDALDCNPIDLFKLVEDECKNDSTTGDSEDEEEEETDMERSDIEDDAPEACVVRAEDMTLRLPSSVCRQVVSPSAAFTRILKMESQLREGQANDSLASLRLGLSEKSLLFVKKVRQARNYSNRTRAWKDINGANHTITRHANVYRIARLALRQLRAEEEVLARYKALKRQDLRVSADVTQPNRIGQRSETLPWIWRLIPENNGDVNGNDWMKECTSLKSTHRQF